MNKNKIYTLYFGDNWITDGYKKEIMKYLNINSKNFDSIKNKSKRYIKYNIQSLRRIIIFIGYDYEFKKEGGSI